LAIACGSLLFDVVEGLAVLKKPATTTKVALVSKTKNNVNEALEIYAKAFPK